MVRKNRILFLLLCISALVMLSLTAYAAGTADNSENDLIIQYTYEDTAIAGADFDIYRIAQQDGKKWKITEPFSATGTGIKCSDENTWNDAALALQGYAEDNGVVPDRSGSTDAKGVLRFENLKSGLYLVVGHRCTVGKYAYTATSFIVAVSDDSGIITVLPKVERSSAGSQSVKIKILKVWDDEKHKSVRPNTILVKLLCDGQVYETAKLSRENNWSYTWKNLKSDHDWCVSEVVPPSYTYLVVRLGNSYVITNTYSSDTPSPVPSPNPTPNPHPTPNPKLPQTGQLWWPVPVLAALGLLCTLIGLARRRGEENE